MERVDAVSTWVKWEESRTSERALRAVRVGASGSVVEEWVGRLWSWGGWVGA